MNPGRYKSVLGNRISIGGDNLEYIDPGEVIVWNGEKATRAGGASLPLTKAQLRAAVKGSWLVPDTGDKTPLFKAQAAGVEMRSAVSDSPTRRRVETTTVDDDNREVGSISSIRRKANTGRVPSTRYAKDAGKTSDQMASSGAEVSKTEGTASGQGRVVGRLKTSAKHEAVEVGKNTRLNSPRGTVTSVYERVETKRFEEPKATVSVGSSTVGSEDDGQVVSSINREEKRSLPRDSTQFLRGWVDGQESIVGYRESDMKKMVQALLRKYDAAYSQAATVAQASPVRVDTSPDEGFQSVSRTIRDAKFTWDMDRHWATRKKAVQDHATSAQHLRYIIREDTSKAVVKEAQKFLSALDLR